MAINKSGFMGLLTSPTSSTKVRTHLDVREVREGNGVQECSVMLASSAERLLQQLAQARAAHNSLIAGSTSFHSRTLEACHAAYLLMCMCPDGRVACWPFIHSTKAPAAFDFLGEEHADFAQRNATPCSSTCCRSMPLGSF